MKKFKLKRPTLLEGLVIASLIILATIILYGCGGAPRVNNGTQPIRLPVISTPNVGSYSQTTNWVIAMCALGLGLGLFSLPFGSGKYGWALVGSCVGATIWIITVDQYAWVLATLVVFGGVIAAILAFTRYRSTVFSFIDGLQRVKDVMHPRILNNTTPERKMVNNLMGSKLTPEAEKLVKTRKAKLKGTNNVDTVART